MEEDEKFLIYTKEILTYFKERTGYYLDLVKEENNAMILGDCYWALANIALNFSNNNDTLSEYIKKAQLNYSKLGDRNDIEGMFLINIVEIEFLFRKGKKTDAKNKLDKFFTLIDNRNYHFYLIGFFVLIKSIVSSNSPNIEDEYASILQKVSVVPLEGKDPDFPNELALINKLVTGLQYKAKIRLFQKAKAMEILQDLLFFPSIYQEIAIIQYIELLLDEIKLYNQPDSYDELKKLIDQLLILGTRSINFNLIMQSFFLNELLKLLLDENSSDIKKNMKNFEQVLLNFPEFNLLSDFNVEKDRFLNLIDKLGNDEFSRNKFQNLESLELETYLHEINKNFLQSQRLTRL